MTTVRRVAFYWLVFIALPHGYGTEGPIAFKDFSIKQYIRPEGITSRELLARVAAEKGLILCREFDMDGTRDQEPLLTSATAPETFYGLLSLFRSKGDRVSNEGILIHVQTFKSLSYQSTPLDLPFGPFSAAGKLSNLNEALTGYSARDGMQAIFTYANPNHGRQDEFKVSSLPGETYRGFLLRIAQENGISWYAELVPAASKDQVSSRLLGQKPKSNYLIAVVLQ